MKKFLILLISIALFSGCASPYVAPSSKPTAEIYVVAENDSTSTILQNVYLWAFKDAECNTNEYGTRLGSVLSKKSPAKTPLHTIAANEPFVFTAVYSDARFMQNRLCAITGEFTPRPNKRYAVRLAVSDNVASCKLGVYDAADSGQAPIDFKMPDQVCEFGAGKTRKNGQPLRIQWVLVPY